MEIRFSLLEEIVSESSYKVNGSETEKNHGKILEALFPNSEIFWKKFIVPLTHRIDSSISDYHKSITPRNGVAENLREIGSFHYSILHNFIYAQASLHFKQPSYFENFYTHLGTICDCVEEFLIHVYYILLECENKKSQILQHCTKEDFIEIAKTWYDENYSKLFDVYLSKGKNTRITLPTKFFVLDEYFGGLKEWKEYKTYSNKIRQYRNVIVHNYTLAFIIDSQGQHYVPKKEKISEYRRWTDPDKAVNNPALLQSDFVLRDKQMVEDLDQMKLVLQNLWKKPISDMNQLFYIDKNESLLKKYNLRLK